MTLQMDMRGNIKMTMQRKLIIDQLDRRIQSLKLDMEVLQENNDGTIAWVDEVRDLMMMIDDLENKKLKWETEY